MNGSAIKFATPFNGISTSSTLKLNAESSSSTESLVTLLNASIKDQRACFKALTQNTVLMSSISHKKIREDEEFEDLVKQMLEKHVDTESEGQETPKKKKKKKKDRDSKKESKFDESVAKKHHKRKHQDFIVPEIEEDVVKFKKTNNQESDLENITNLKSCSPHFDSDYLLKKRKKLKNKCFSEMEDNTPVKKIKNKKHKHSSISETDGNYERTVLENDSYEINLENVTPKKKHKRSIVSEALNIDNDLPQNKKHKTSVSVTESDLEKSILLNDLPVKIKIKKKHKHSKILEQEENGPALRENKHQHLNVSEIEDINETIKKKKKHKYRSVSEGEDGLATTKKKKKHKHLTVSESEEGHETFEKKKKNKHLDVLETEGDDIHSTEKSSPKNKDKHSNISESINLENETPKTLKRKKHKNKENDSYKKINFDESPEKRKTHAHSSMSEADDQGEKTLENSSPKKRKKKHQYSSVSELDNGDYEIKKEADSFSPIANNSARFEFLNMTSASTEGVKINPNLSPQNKPKVLTTPKSTHLVPISCSSSDEQEKVKTPNKSELMDLINEALDATAEDTLDSTDTAFLSELCILVPWEVPPSHMIETRLSHPTPKQYKQFKELPFAMKSGPYTKEEDEKIKDNWEEFCKLHDLKLSPSVFCPVEGVNHNVLPAHERIKFVQFLGKNLQNRNLSSIYGRFQILFKPFKKGRFTPEEDNIILTFVENSSTPNKYAALSKILNRRRELIKTRHQTLKANDDKIKWNMSLYQQVINNLLEATGKTNIEDLKDLKFEVAHWKACENKMNIPAKKIRRKWSMHISPSLFGDEYNTLSEIRAKLVNLLFDNEVDDRKKLDWHKLAEHFDGMTNSRLSKIFSDLVDQQVPAVCRKNFTDTVKYLKEKLPHILVTNTKRVVKFIYRDGQLYDSKKFEPIVTF